MTWLLVDAMNVIGSRPDGWWHDRDGAVRDLVVRVREAAPHLADRITVVVDGPGRDEPADAVGVAVVRAGRGPDAADDRIVELLESAAGDIDALVVTADGALRERVAERGATTQGPRALLDTLDRLAPRTR